MNEAQSILENVKVLISELRQVSASSAQRIEDIAEDRDIWDKMVIRLSAELESLLNRQGMTENVKAIARGLFAQINPKRLGSFSDAIYSPMRALATEIGASGLPDWQVKIEDAIATGSTSTEIFMALRWHLDQLLKSDQALPAELRRKAQQFHDQLDKALQVH